MLNATEAPNTQMAAVDVAYCVLMRSAIISELESLTKRGTQKSKKSKTKIRASNSSTVHQLRQLSKSPWPQGQECSPPSSRLSIQSPSVLQFPTYVERGGATHHKDSSKILISVKRASGRTTSLSAKDFCNQYEVAAATGGGEGQVAS